MSQVMEILAITLDTVSLPTEIGLLLEQPVMEIWQALPALPISLKRMARVPGYSNKKFMPVMAPLEILSDGVFQCTVTMH